ncbi:hypothetical protein N0V93_003859 [Gnomoniopsis smithogilvyi]|uniref:F-box domain-containing protein n=1 Tax=Gnomoniopsis smithogilvyi TaxID=1191159 RepID=A0A9W8Z1L0_9PEZI|nr:hypothetical protein N0V93_003859 [Gnomoniopsis smithogilvyi]
MNQVPKLPLELIYHIIDSVLPGDPRTVLRPSGSTTKTLLSLTRVCRAIYPLASNHLRKHCIYIDNDQRLRDLIRCVESACGGVSSSSNDRHSDLTTTSVPLSLPLGVALCPITSLYLAPFRDTIDNLPIAIWIRELFCLVQPTLRRLVIDIPLRSLYPADDHLDVRKTLREAFSMLTNLEEFVSVRDELYLDLLEPEWRTERETAVWSLWPRLKRLALYQVAADEMFWASVRAMRDLDTVILTRADDLERVCIKSHYLDASTTGPSAGESGFVDEAETQDEPQKISLKVVLVNISNQQPNNLAGEREWDKVDPGNRVKVMLYDVPTSFYGDDSPCTLCQQWVKAASLRGQIWDWEGSLVHAKQSEEPS